MPSIAENDGATPIPAEDIDATFTGKSIDLIAADLGGKVLAFSDEWFAEGKNLIGPKEIKRDKGRFDERGAW